MDGALIIYRWCMAGTYILVRNNIIERERKNDNWDT